MIIAADSNINVWPSNSCVNNLIFQHPVVWSMRLRNGGIETAFMTKTYIDRIHVMTHTPFYFTHQGLEIVPMVISNSRNATLMGIETTNGSTRLVHYIKAKCNGTPLEVASSVRAALFEYALSKELPLKTLLV